jgi:glycosyltransferase involved in cell wall biosynthesis
LQKLMHVIESAAGGSLQYVIDVCHLVQDQFDITIVHGQRPDTPRDLQSLLPPGVNLIHLAVAREITLTADYQALRTLMKLMRLVNPDIVHLHSSKAGALGRVAARMIRVPRVFYTPHSFAFLREDIPTSKRVVYRALEYVGARLGGEFIAVGRTEGELARRLYRSARVHLVENAVLTDIPFRTRYVQDMAPIVVGVGRLSEQKNPLRFVRVAAEISKRMPNVRFLWIGDGELRAQVESAISSHAARVEITGWVSRHEVYELLSNASVYLQTSRWEGASLAVLDALAIGVPMVATDIAGNTDILQHDRTGILGHTDEELVRGVTRLLSDRSIWDSMNMAAHAEVETRFSKQRFVSSLLQAYNGAL